MTLEMTIELCLLAFIVGYGTVTIMSRPVLPELPSFPPNIVSPSRPDETGRLPPPAPMESTKYIAKHLADADPITQADILYYALRKVAEQHADTEEEMHKWMMVWVRDVCIERYPGVNWR